MNRGRGLAAIAATAALIAPLSARAQAPLEVSTQVSARQVELGESIDVQMSVLSEGDLGSPANARLPAAAGLQVRGPRMGTQSQVSITNGHLTRRSGVNLTWTVTATKPGIYRVGPPTAEFNGSQARGQAVNFEVVPAGAAPRGRRGMPFPFDPFDMLNGLGGLSGPRFPGFPFDEPQNAPPEPQVPPEFQLEHAPDPIAFVITKATPREVVVGQAINFKSYAYASQGLFDVVDANEPSRDGFLAYTVDQPQQLTPIVVPIEGRQFVARQLTEMVLFPIRSGTLRIGSQRLGISGRGYQRTPGAIGLMRQSQPIDIVVREPPLAGRPPGYRVGDVGDYSLKAQVDPRKLKQGDSLAIVATLSGTGNVPAKLIVPQQNGVEFADPTVLEKIDTDSSGVHGSRTFTFIVRVDKTGSFDLGELRLPYYNPDRRRYETAQASLGRIEVTADNSAPPAVASSGVPEDHLVNLLKPRTRLSPAGSGQAYLSDRPWFALGLFAGPGLVLAVTGLRRLGQRLSERLQAQQNTPRRLAERELELLNEAVARGDLALVAAGVERALHFAIEGATGLKSRGVLRRELGMALVQRGVPAELGAEVVALLEATELARFQADEPSEASNLLERGRRAVTQLTARPSFVPRSDA